MIKFKMLVKEEIVISLLETYSSILKLFISLR